MEGFARALARLASDREKLLARPRKLLVPDDRTGLLLSPDNRIVYILKEALTSVSQLSQLQPHFCSKTWGHT